MRKRNWSLYTYCAILSSGQFNLLNKVIVPDLFLFSHFKPRFFSIYTAAIRVQLCVYVLIGLLAADVTVTSWWPK